MKIQIEDLGTPTLTKADFSELLCEQIGLNKREAKEMVESFFDSISQRLADGNNVKIADFAAFEVQTKMPRSGRNLHTGEQVLIKARRVVTFRAGPKLKARVNGQRASQAALRNITAS